MKTIMATEIYIGNLPDDITEIVFKNKLKIFGNISSALVRKFEYDGRPKKSPYGFITYFEKEHAEKCVKEGKKFLSNMFGTDILVNWSNRNYSPQYHSLNNNKSSNGSCTSKSDSSSYGPKSSASSSPHKNQRKKCKDPTCNQFLMFGENFCPKCSLDQNFNMRLQIVKRSQKDDIDGTGDVSAVQNSNQNALAEVSDFSGIDREFSTILKLNRSVDNLRQQKGSSDDSNNNVDFNSLPSVLIKVQDFLRHHETKFDQLIQSINRAEEFYYTCREMVHIDNVEESLLPLYQQSLDGASQAYYRKLVEYLEKCQYNYLDSLSYEIMQEKYKLMPPTYKSLDDLSTSQEILREIERIQEQNDFPTANGATGNGSIPPPTVTTNLNCDPETNTDELLETLSNYLSQIALTMKEPTSCEETNLPKIEPLLKEIKEKLENRNNALEEEILYKLKTLGLEDQGRIFIVFQIVIESIESQMIKYKAYYRNIQELCQNHNFTFHFETSKIPVFLEIQKENNHNKELPTNLENCKPKKEKSEYDDRLSDVIFPGDDDLDL